MKIHQIKAKITLVFDGIKVAFSHPLGLTVSALLNGQLPTEFSTSEEKPTSPTVWTSEDELYPFAMTHG